MLMNLVRLHRENFKLLWILIGLFAVIQVAIAGVMLILRPDTIVSISALALLFPAALCTLLCTISHTTFTFEHGVRMGLTRRHSLSLGLFLATVEGTVFFAAALVLSLVEQVLVSQVWMRVIPGLRLEIDGLYLVPWWMFPLFLVGTLVVSLVVGALVQRFGGRAGWVLWGLWMSWFLLFQHLPWKMLEITNWMIPTAAGLVAVLAIWSVWSLLHAGIKR